MSITNASQPYGGLLGVGNSNQGMQGMAGTINQYANQVLAQYPSPNTITITIEEVSNGSIIRIGGLIRLAPSNENLMEHVGAAYTQYFLNKEKK